MFSLKIVLIIYHPFIEINNIYFQEERFLLRNMERQEPQGEETHHPVPHFGQFTHAQYQYHPPPPYTDRLDKYTNSTSEN